jgi:hypothetical protein
MWIAFVFRNAVNPSMEAPAKLLFRTVRKTNVDPQCRVLHMTMRPIDVRQLLVITSAQVWWWRRSVRAPPLGGDALGSNRWSS